MVKTPRTRHSQGSKEPVTIDLSPGEVSRVKAEAEKSGASSSDQSGPNTVAEAVEEGKSAEVKAETQSETGGATAAKPAEAKPSAVAGSSKPADGAGSTASDASKAGAASSAASSSSQSFGRKEPPSQPPPTARRGSSGGGLLAGLAGGVVALLLAGGLIYSGAVPLPGNEASQEPDPGPVMAVLEEEIAALRDQIAAMPAASAEDPELQGRLSETEETVSTFASELYSLRDEVQQLGAQPGGDAASVDLAPLEERITALSRQLDASREAQAATASRLDSIEETLATLSGRVEEAAEQPATARIIAASALKAAIDRGMPFSTELETYLSLASDASAASGLREMASGGVPTRTQIAAESDAAANAMIAAGRTEDPNAGILDRLTSSAMGLVQVRPIGMVEGEDVPAIAARLDAAVQAGDYERALAEYDTLPAEAKAAGQAFIEKVRARLAADSLVNDALAAALQN